MLQELNDLRTHLEQGAELLASHLPGLLELAGRLEQDPLVQAVLGLAVPDTTRAMLASLVQSVAADSAAVAQAAAAQAAAAAAPPADPSAPA